MEPYKIISYFECPHTNNVYHIHPELVQTENTINNETFGSFTMICHRCSKACDKDTCGKYSIAAGVDFGLFHRIKGLECPNLHEEMILSKYRLYQTIVKILPNGSGWQKNLQ